MPTVERQAANYKVLRDWIEEALERASRRADKDEWHRGRRDILQSQLDLMDQLDQIP